LGEARLVTFKREIEYDAVTYTIKVSIKTGKGRD